jgi:hypothetical protein
MRMEILTAAVLLIPAFAHAAPPSRPVDLRRLPGLSVPAPEFTVDAPAIFELDGSDLHDSLSDQDCAGAPARIDRLEAAILDLKARYWALRLKKGVKAEALAVNPGSTISDPDLKRQFYERLKSWHALRRVPELSSAESSRFDAVDAAALALYRKCLL